MKSILSDLYISLVDYAASKLIVKPYCNTLLVVTMILLFQYYFYLSITLS